MRAFPRCRPMLCIVGCRAQALTEPALDRAGDPNKDPKIEGDPYKARAALPSGARLPPCSRVGTLPRLT